jgi:hypothetical protein
VVRDGSYQNNCELGRPDVARSKAAESGSTPSTSVIMGDWNEDYQAENLDIAIIGIEGRYPWAGTIEEFWLNLRDPVESIRFFTDDELKRYGVDPLP